MSVSVIIGLKMSWPRLLLTMAFDTSARFKVLINAFSARLGGGQTYLTNLLDFLSDDTPVEVFVLVPDSLRLPEDRANIHRIHVRWPVENPATRALWERIYLPRLVRELGADVLFCPGGIIGANIPRGCKSVTTFQNMIPFDSNQRRKYPLGYMRVRNWLLKRIMVRSMAKADRVICGSEFARQVIVKIAPALMAKTIVIPHGINSHFRGDHLRRPEWLPGENYILYVSILDVYKAQLEVVRAYALLKQYRRTNEKLILAGPERQPYAQKVRDEIIRLGLEQDVFLAGSVEQDQLPALYQNALINIFASECENCPNIMLEALASGRPLLSSNRPPMPEFGGDAPIYFEPSSPEDLANKLLSIIDDPVRMGELSDKAAQRSLLYDWDRAWRATWDLILNCA
jgi:glycosyltransferase involved in cell wall biosynthesis